MPQISGCSRYGDDRSGANDTSLDLSVMMNICKVFHCDIGDLMEVIENE